ncbi:hypothetical protein DL93DRAFT_2089056 [Clavulina sp. PMI_390]|nr:hypothetical protein DL93DRAFT_2089056 [Clavulina sp. PMI_390]
MDTPSPVVAALKHFFLPSTVIPPSVNQLNNNVALCIILSCVSLTYKGRVPSAFRVALFFPAAYYSYYTVCKDHDVPNRIASSAITFGGSLLAFKAFDICIVSLFDREPPHWVKNGKLVPLPETLVGRVAYAVDLFFSFRGSSWFGGYSWDWAPKYIAAYSPPKSRISHISRGVLTFLAYYLALDACETFAQQEKWDLSQAHPVLTLPLSKQLLFSLFIATNTFIVIQINYIFISVVCVMMGSSPSSWPPMFNRPFTSKSLQDFWSNRWHHYFKRAFERASIPAMVLVPQSWSPAVRRVTRAIIIFGFSTVYHLYLVQRNFSVRNWETKWQFVDSSTLLFFLLQPVGLLIERALLVPLSRSLPETSQTWVTRIWVWGWLLWTGRYWADVWVRSGMWNVGAGHVAWSPIRGVIFNQWFLL